MLKRWATGFAVVTMLAFVTGCGSAPANNAEPAATPKPAETKPAENKPADEPAAKTEDKKGVAVGSGKNASALMIDWPKANGTEEETILAVLKYDLGEDIDAVKKIAAPSLLKQWEGKKHDDIEFGFGAYNPPSLTKPDIKLKKTDGNKKYYEVSGTLRLKNGLDATAMWKITLEKSGDKWLLAEFEHNFHEGSM